MPAIYDTVPKDKWPAFIKLVSVMTSELGTEEAACRFCGLDSGHYSLIRRGRQVLSTTVAKKILAGYKKFKEQAAPSRSGMSKVHRVTTPKKGGI